MRKSESAVLNELVKTAMKDDGMQYVLKNEPQLGLLNNMLDVMCIKTFADGSMGGRSAAMLKEYSDAPGRLGEYIYTDEDMTVDIRFPSTQLVTGQTTRSSTRTKQRLRQILETTDCVSSTISASLLKISRER